MATLTHSPASSAPSAPDVPRAASRAHAGLTEEQKNWYACLFFLGSVALSFVMGIVALALV